MENHHFSWENSLQKQMLIFHSYNSYVSHYQAGYILGPSVALSFFMRR